MEAKKPMVFYRNPNFRKTFASLTMQLALQNLLTYSVNLMDNLQLGGYSETALSGSALCNQFQYLLQQLVVSGGDGIVVMGTQYWGRKKLEPISHIVGIGLRYALCFSLVMLALMQLIPEQMMGLLTNDTAVIAEAVAYVRIVSISYVLFAVTNTLLAALRTIGIVKVGYIVSASTLCINMFLNNMLIYGRLGAPELGARGAAIATLISRAVELIIVIVYLTFREHQLNLNLKKLICADLSYHRDYRKVAFPVVVAQGQWGIAMLVQTGILGHMGAVAIAANSIATIVFQIVSVVAYGSGSAASILIGRTIGANEDDLLKPMVHSMEVTFLCIGVITGLLIFLVRVPVLSLYNISGDATALAMQFMAVLSLTTVGTAFQQPCDNGIIRGGGDTKFSLYMNFISMWGIIVPFSALAAFVWKLPAIAVFFLLKWDQLYKCIPVAIRLHSWKWIRHVTRD